MKLTPEKKIKASQKASKMPDFEGNYKKVYWAVGMFLVGNVLTVIYGFSTMIPFIVLLGYILLFIAVGYGLQILLFRTIFHMKRMEQLMFAAFGLGPIFTAIFLLLNYYVHDEYKTISTRIEKVYFKSGNQYFLSNDLPCEDYPELCKVDPDDLKLYRFINVDVTLAKGIGGYWTIDKVVRVE